MDKFIIAFVAILIIGLFGFLIADRWGAEDHYGTATVIEHIYNEAYTTYDSFSKTTTYHDEEFILIVKYEDIIERDTIKKYLWHSVHDGDIINIVYSYGNFSGSFYMNIIDKTE